MWSHCGVVMTVNSLLTDAVFRQQQSLARRKAYVCWLKRLVDWIRLSSCRIMRTNKCTRQHWDLLKLTSPTYVSSYHTRRISAVIFAMIFYRVSQIRREQLLGNGEFWFNLIICLIRNLKLVWDWAQNASSQRTAWHLSTCCSWIYKCNCECNSSLIFFYKT